jgi:hypothetical protein
MQKHGFEFSKKEDGKYKKAIQKFGVSASEIMHWLKTHYHAIEFIECSNSWIIEKTMIYLSEKRSNPTRNKGEHTAA